MKEDASKKEIIYQHYKNKKMYKIVGKTLIQINDEWEQAVIYKSLDYKYSTFVRSEEEFFDKFKQVED